MDEEDGNSEEGEMELEEEVGSSEDDENFMSL